MSRTGILTARDFFLVNERFSCYNKLGYYAWRKLRRNNRDKYSEIRTGAKP